MFLKICVPVKLVKSLKNIFYGVYFYLKLHAEGCNFTKSEPLHRYFSRILLTFLEVIYLSLSLFISPYPSIFPAISPLALHYFKHSFHSYLSLFLLISKGCRNLGITKPCTHLHPAPSTSTQLISASTQLSATPSTIFEPKYRT